MAKAFQVVDEKLLFIRNAQKEAMQQAHAYSILNGEERLKESEQVLEHALAHFFTDDAAFDLLENFASHYEKQFIHGLVVSTYSILTVQNLSWTSPKNLAKVAITGLLHDIGVSKIKRETVDKARHERTCEETQEYETHCRKGYELLSPLASVVEDIPQIILQHHENCLGQGFPQGLRREDIHPLARVVSAIDIFCDLSVQIPTTPAHDAFKVLMQMYSLYLPTLDPETFAALIKVFRKPP